MTKDELLKENGEAFQRLEVVSAKDKEIRQEFARAFNWKKPTGMYNSDVELFNPSWNQIFIEIGKLQATQSFYDLQGSVTELRRQVQNINEQLIESTKD